MYREHSWHSWVIHQPRSLCDELVNLYLSSFEKVLRVFHRPTFQRQYRQYWETPHSSAGQAFFRNLSVVMAIGACIHPDFKGSQSPLRSCALKWVLDAQSWIGSILDDADVSLATLQTYCLLLIARQASALGPSTIWISTDALIRVAMRLGAHRSEQSIGSNLTAADVQLRRKLWSTVVELSIQSSLDSGFPPSVIPADLQLDLPLNVNDAQLEESSQEPPASHGSSPHPTDSAVQIMLAGTASVRLKIVHHLYGFDADGSYEKTLQLSKELDEKCRMNAKTLQSLVSHSSTSQTNAITGFHMKLLDTLTLGFLMALHSPFALRARVNPTFYYSRKVCFEAAWTLETRSMAPWQQSGGVLAQEIYSRLRLHASGLFERVHSHATALICLEMLNSFTEESFLSSSLVNREAVFDVIQHDIDLCANRLENGSTDVASHMIFTCALAYVRALERAEKPEVWVAEAARRSLSTCLEILQKAAAGVAPDGPGAEAAAENVERNVQRNTGVLDGRGWPELDALDFPTDRFPQVSSLYTIERIKADILFSKWSTRSTSFEMPNVFGVASAFATDILDIDMSTTL
jgi:Fungal specific transcription factor domain